MIKKIATLLTAFWLAGCSTFKEPSTYAGIAGDGITTYIGVTNPAKFTEVNPLSLATIPLSIMAIEYAEKQPREKGLQIIHSVRSAKWAGFVNNMLVFAGAPTPVSIIAGLGIGYYLWKRGEDERWYANFCADWIAKKSGNTCKPWVKR